MCNMWNECLNNWVAQKSFMKKPARIGILISEWATLYQKVSESPYLFSISQPQNVSVMENALVLTHTYQATGRRGIDVAKRKFQLPSSVTTFLETDFLFRLFLRWQKYGKEDFQLASARANFCDNLLSEPWTLLVFEKWWVWSEFSATLLGRI